MRKFFLVSALSGMIAASMAQAGVMPEDMLQAPGSLSGEPTSGAYVDHAVALLVETHNTQESTDAALVDKVLGKANSEKSKSEVSPSNSQTSALAISVDSRQYKGMYPCDGECPVDPDEIRNTLVYINMMDGLKLIDLVRQIMPQNWTVVVDNVNPKKLIESYAFVNTDTREHAMEKVSLASDLEFEFVYDNYDKGTGAHAPILIVHPGDAI